MKCFAFLLVLFFCATCAAPPPEEPGASSLELGVGITAFQTFPSSGVPLVFGPQGGWHVDLAVRVTGVSPDGSELSYELRDPETQRVLTYPTRTTLNLRRVSNDGVFFVRVGDRAVFDIMTETEVLGRSVEFIATLRSASGRTLRDVRLAPIVRAP